MKSSISRTRNPPKTTRSARGSITLPMPDRGEDRTYRRTGLSVGKVAGTETSPFVYDFYKSPIHDIRYKISIGNSLNSEKRKNFADLEAKRL